MYDELFVKQIQELTARVSKMTAQEVFAELENNGADLDEYFKRLAKNQGALDVTRVRKTPGCQ